MPDQTPSTANALLGDQSPRGGAVDTPTQVPPRGWKDIFIRAWKDGRDNNLSLIAGGVTYYSLVALFPALAALVSIYGLIANPATVANNLNAVSGMLPPSAQKLIGDELNRLVATSHGALGLGAALGLLFTLWSASRGMRGMIKALDVAYDLKETRGIVRFNLIALGLTLVMMIGGLVLIGFVAILPAVLAGIGAHGAVKWLILILEWPLLLAVMVMALAALYRYAPDRRKPRWEWTSPGALFAAIFWVIGSILFTVYVSNFAHYNKTYGSLGAVVVLLTWLWFSIYLVLFGAEINGQAERQTARDTTAGTQVPMGQPSATAVDTLARRQA